MMMPYIYSVNERYPIKLASLLETAPSSSQCHIKIEHFRDTDGEEYDQVYGIVPGDEQTYCIGVCQREELLGMGIAQSTMEDYSSAEIIAHCLYEMTFFGFRDEDLAIFKKQLEESLYEDLD